MSRSRIVLEGFLELRQALRNLPAELNAEAQAIVIAHAAEAKQQVSSAYPIGPTGNLKRGVTMRHETSKGGTVALVSSRAKHAWLFEHGSRQRRTSSGANRGSMPEADRSEQMIPIIIRARRRMVAALMHLVERAGFVVTPS